jgi:hypothetical protein
MFVGGEIFYVIESQIVFNCYFIQTQHCQKESNGYFVPLITVLKNLSSLSYFNDCSAQTRTGIGLLGNPQQ